MNIPSLSECKCKGHGIYMLDCEFIEKEEKELLVKVLDNYIEKDEKD